MSRLLVAVAGTFAFVWGGVVLLYLLPWLLLRHPRLQGATTCSAWCRRP
jgi:hypothetical protein